MNVCMQLLYNLVDFRKLLSSQSIITKLTNAKCHIGLELSELMTKMDRKERGLDVLKFRSSLSHASCTLRCFVSGEQHDAIDFLRALIILLCKEIDTRTNRPIYEMFSSHLKHSLECTKCGVIHNCAPEWNFCIELPICGSTLKECLDSYFFNSNIIDWNNCQNGCSSGAKGRNYYEKREILILTLKRSPETLISFPVKKLDMTPYGALEEDCILEYHLIGVINYNGDAESGHYYIYLNISDRWCVFNDMKVSRISEKVIVTKQAYSLIYRKSVKEKTHIVEMNCHQQESRAKIRRHTIV